MEISRRADLIRRSCLILCALLAATLILWLLPSFGMAADSQQGTVEFNRDIRPILSDKCYACHGPDKSNRKTNFHFDSEEGAFIPLTSGGAVIVRGDAAKSPLYQRVASQDKAVRMPPAYMGRDKLSDHEISLIQRW